MKQKKKHKRYKYKEEEKKMGKNINSQFHYVINDNFSESVDKHSYKKEHGREATEKIFSYDSKFNALDVAKNFSNYLKENFTDVKQIRDIKGEHIQSFLNTRATTCQDSALKNYSKMMEKLELAAEKTFGIDLRWKGEFTTPLSTKSVDDINSKRGAEAVISRTDLNTIVAYATEHRSQSGDAVRLQEHIGVRVNEIVTIKMANINLDKGTLLLDNCKGGKDLVRVITPECKAVLKDIISQSYGKDNLFTIKSGSVNDYLGKLEKRLGLEHHPTHDIRRLVAQELYDKYRNSGKGIKESLSEVSLWLNHGKERDEMMAKSYVANVW